MIHPKAALIERLQKDGRGKPQFVTEREGPDHEPTFFARVKVQGQPFGEGRGGNKREAERRAAEEALARLDRDAAEGGKGSGKRKPRKASARGEAPADVEASPEAEAPGDVAAFAGPWPVFDRVLAEAMRIAHERVDADLRGDAALVGIETFAVRLDQDVLEELGEVVEEDEAG